MNVANYRNFRGYLITNCIIAREKDEFILKMVTENAAAVRRVYNAFRGLYGVTPVTNIDEKVKGKDTLLELVVSNKDDLEKIFRHSWINIDVSLQIVMDDNNAIQEKECCMRSFLRGAFMGGGSVSDPNSTNHLEIVLDNEQNANFIISVLNMCEITAKKMKRKNRFVIYMKDAEMISQFLILIGSNRGTIAFEEARTLKNYKNYRNRKDNCETANWDKTAKAASEQQKDIIDIKEAKAFEKLPTKLKQIANLRMKYPMAGLGEIGEMLAPPLSKAGVSHRFHHLHEIAEEIRAQGKVHN